MRETCGFMIDSAWFSIAWALRRPVMKTDLVSLFSAMLISWLDLVALSETTTRRRGGSTVVAAIQSLHAHIHVPRSGRLIISQKIASTAAKAGNPKANQRQNRW